MKETILRCYDSRTGEEEIHYSPTTDSPLFEFRYDNISYVLFLRDKSVTLEIYKVREDGTLGRQIRELELKKNRCMKYNKSSIGKKVLKNGIY